MSITKQKCGECTLCCKLLEIYNDDKTILSPIDSDCQNCNVAVGCTIYKDRPTACRIYQCMWLQMAEVKEEMRPDKCGIIFDRQSDDVISARIDKDIKLSALVIAQIKAFNGGGFSVLIFKDNNNSKCYPKLGHTEEYVRKIVDERFNR